MSIAPRFAPRILRRARPLAAMLAIATLLFAGCARDTTPPLVKPLHVDLTTPVDEQVDLAWPLADGTPVAEHAIDQPRQVTLRLPNGKLLSTPSTRIAFRQQDGLLVSVNVTPAAGAQAHEAALAQVRGLLDDNQLLDPGLARTLDSWAPGTGDSQSTRLVVNNVDVMVALRQDPKTGWQTTFDFEPRSCLMPPSFTGGNPDACLHVTPGENAVAADVRG
ncbi:hypothetical protein LDO26_17525 [Luteimonas sp. BDR2-5]|uniref:hypothetical protein n=1 Tax=Proluteimonas luteida TaxID=2878685 RepID=UPI001E42D0F3|nr:hypothetical protein [Luteimonas sp. BDR2-5]MCD9029993.1 hypothetical protein [Luteimonas sp. BDR2-5]